MQISRRLTNGLAWAGLLIVVGVPSADILTAQFMGEPETIGSAVAGAPVVIDVGNKPRLDETRAAGIATPATPQATPSPAPAPERTQVAETVDPVDQYLQSGRPLPSYISDDGETAAAPAAKPQQPAAPTEVATRPSPAPVKVPSTVSPAAPAEVAIDARPPVLQTEAVDVAAVAPDTKVAPVPMPLSMRPKPVTEPIVIPSSVQQTTPSYPVVPSQPVAGYDDVVTAEELEDWESGPLSEFLAERGQGGIDPGYDPNGFFLDEGPSSRATYRREVIEPPVVYVYPLYN